jgi:excisionase family DNA binding protein
MIANPTPEAGGTVSLVGSSGIPPCMTVAEVQAALRIGRNQVYALIASGELPSIRIGARTLRVTRAALDAYIRGDR